jgi:hypothetical protein
MVYPYHYYGADSDVVLDVLIFILYFSESRLGVRRTKGAELLQLLPHWVVSTGFECVGFEGILWIPTNLVFGVLNTNILLYRKSCWAGIQHIQYYNTHYIILHLSKKGKGRFLNFMIGNYRFNNIISLNHDYLQHLI